MHLILRSTVLALVSALTTAAASRAEAPRPWRLVVLYRGTDGGPAGAVDLGPITASDCGAQGVDSAPPQETMALKFLRIRAARAGADAIVRVSCNSVPAKGCSSAVTCAGEAVKLPKDSRTSK